MFAPWEIFSHFFVVNFLKKLFQEYHQSVKQFGSKLFCKGYQQTIVCLFDLILYVPSTIFQL